MAAEDLQFVRDHFSHRERWVGLITEEQSDLYVPAAPPKREDRISTGASATERVDGDVNSALRELANCFRDVGDSNCVKCVSGSGLPGQSEFLVRNVDANDVSAE